MAQAALKSHFPELMKHRHRLEKTNMREMFQADAKRAKKFSVECSDLLFDYSKNRIDEASLSQLLELAASANLSDAISDMFSGKKINFTENRAALHTALRSNTPLMLDGNDIRAQVNASKKELFAFAANVREATYLVSGGAISDVVNIGIGGSDLGPLMCTRALSPYHDGPKTYFISNVDGADFSDVTAKLNPATTLFIIASKSFTTLETMANAKLARQWLRKSVSEKDLGRHFVALSTNLSATKEFGISPENTFGFWDWVGGRYSIWSAIGLSLMIAIGAERFQEFLDGGLDADQHFANSDFSDNIPVLMALIGIWHRNIWDYSNHAILPYDNRLRRLPAYLQQLDMESNGKHICRDGENSYFSTGPVIWGEPGTNGQHAFYQLLHQGTNIVPCDFFIAASSHEEDQTHQRLLVANCLAQSQAMMAGRTLKEAKENLQNSGRSSEDTTRLAPHKVFEGNRPSNTFFYPKLTPFVLGQLIAFYEHKIFVQGVIWQINSFDQWGVELGKQLALRLSPLLDEGANPSISTILDPSTANLIARFHILTTQNK